MTLEESLIAAAKEVARKGGAPDRLIFQSKEQAIAFLRATMPDIDPNEAYETLALIGRINEIPVANS